MYPFRAWVFPPTDTEVTVVSEQLLQLCYPKLLWYGDFKTFPFKVYRTTTRALALLSPFAWLS